LKLYKSP